MNEFDRNISFRIMASGEKFWILRVTLDIDTLCLRAFEILNNYHEQMNENVQFFFLFLSEIKILSQAYSVRIILSNLDTIILNVKYNSVSVVSKKRKRFSRGRRWSSHESGQNREAKDRPRTATYTRPLLIICHRLSTGRAKIFLRQFSFFFTRFAFFSPPFHSLSPRFVSISFMIATKNVIDDNARRHLFLSLFSGQQKLHFSFLAISHLLALFYTRYV